MVASEPITGDLSNHRRPSPEPKPPHLLLSDSEAPEYCVEDTYLYRSIPVPLAHVA